MNTITIPIQQGQTLADALKSKGYQEIPSDIIFDKTLTGIGATYMEIHAKRNSIIIEPNVPVIDGKLKQHPECLAVKKGVRDNTIRKYLTDDSIRYKKILTTPESFYKVTRIAAEEGINIHETYFCLFDECEKISQDYDYRDSIAFPINDFFQFRQKAFISATPTGFANKHFEQRGFSTIKVYPADYDHRINLELITTNVFMRSVKDKLEQLASVDNACIFVFFNSIRGIKAIIDTFHLQPEQYAVFCSDSRYNELKTEGYNVQNQVTDATIRKFNFLTSRYYSAVDFNLSVCPDIVMQTNQATAPHSRIDPLSEAVQIQGRFRKKQPDSKRFNSICHITDLMIVEALSPQDIEKSLKQWYHSAKQLKERYLSADTEVEKKAILRDYQQSTIYKYLDTPDFESEFKINLFSLLNLYYKERVKACYKSSESLLQMYENADYFYLTHTDAFDYSFSLECKDIHVNRINKKTPQKEQIQSVLNMLRSGVSSNDILNQHKENPDQYVNLQNTIQLVELVGMEEVRPMKTFAAVEKALLLAQQFKASEELRFSPEILARIKVEFEADLQNSILITKIQKRLQEIYDTFGIITKDGKPFKVAQNTIEDYFKQKRNNESRTYRLIAMLPELEAKINDI